MDQDAAVEATGLRVTFPSGRGPVEALKGLDLRIPKGSLFVLLGPNGAGKTTLMRCITSLVRPTAGGLRVFGAESADGRDRAARLRRIGVLIENPGAYGRLDAREYLSFFASFYGAPGMAGRVEELCEGFGLALDGKRVSKLSQGNRQKLQLVRSLLHSPDLLLWDEPTDHLDPEAQAKVLGYLGSYLRKEGATALLATHRLEQMESLGTHFGFLNQGRLALAGTRAEVLGGGPTVVRIGFASAPSPVAVDLAASDLGLTVRLEGDGAAFSGCGLDESLPALVKALALADLPIRAVEPVRASLAEVYGKAMAP
jgi:ABC-2 type transport system ATP-binding protein